MQQKHMQRVRLMPAKRTQKRMISEIRFPNEHGGISWVHKLHANSNSGGKAQHKRRDETGVGRVKVSGGPSLWQESKTHC